MTYLLTPSGLEIGRPFPWKSILIPGGTAATAASSAAILNQIMPGGGTANVLTLAGNNNISTTGAFKNSYLTKQGRINNVLISQTIAVSLAARMSGVDAFAIEYSPTGDSWFQTQDVTTPDCINFTEVPCTADSFAIQQSVADYLTSTGTATATVADLLNLANGLLSGALTPGGIDNVPSYAATANALSTIIAAFDGWRFYSGAYGTDLNFPCYPVAKMTGGTGANMYTVYPNPNNGSFMVALSSGVDNADIAILDLTGKVIEKRSNVKGHQQFHLDRVSLGMYMVQITIGKETFRTKISIL
jgi:hypothetical protein